VQLNVQSWLWLATLLPLMAATQHAHAYSSFADYARPIEEGGGGGKFFSGTPADGYTCDVCHTGGAPAKLDVIGLPTAGYVPGQTYQIAFQWPMAARDTVPHVALMVELTDDDGVTAGTPSLVPYAQWTDAEKCAQDAFPAGDICRAGAEPGCCRELDPTRDACSFPEQRSFFWMLECGARAARFDWTAPTQPVEVWFSASIVSSSAGNDAAGDGVTLVRQLLRPASAADTRTSAIGSCEVQHAHARSSRFVAYAWLGALAWIALRFAKICPYISRTRARARARTRSALSATSDQGSGTCTADHWSQVSQ